VSLNPAYSSRFHRDVRLAERRGKDLAKLRIVADLLIEQVPLAPRLRDHPLKGEFIGHRECHIEPDWLLIYQVREDRNEIHFARTGTHSDLFG
jgi:mRNA interferase YafQ